MARRRITPFARLLLFLLIFLPLSYVVASFYNGEDPIANVKRWIGLETPAAQVQETSAPATPPSESDTAEPATMEVETSNPEAVTMEQLQQEIKEIRTQLEAQQQAIEALQAE